MYYILLYFI